MNVNRKMNTAFHHRRAERQTVRDVFYDAHRKFKYDPESGELRYRDGRVCRNRVRLLDFTDPAKALPGEEICRRCLGSRPYTVRRVVWLMNYGYLPKRLTHANGDKEDNRLENLREGSPEDPAPSDPKSEIQGVFEMREGEWKACLTVDGKLKQLGTFGTFEGAVYARFYAEMEADWLGTETPSPAELFVVNSGMLDGYLLSYS